MEEQIQEELPKVVVVHEWMFNPWVQRPEITCLVMLILALMCFWAYKRLNPCILYAYLGVLLIIDGIFLFLNMRDNPFPQLWQMGVMAVLGFIILVILNTLFLTYLILRLNKMGIEKSWMVREGFGSTKLGFSVAASTAFFLLVRMAASTSFLFMVKSMMLSWGLRLFIYLCLIFLLSILSSYLLPVTEQKTSDFLFGNERADWTLEDVFIPLGSARRGEIIVTLVTGMALYISLSLLGKVYYTALDKMAIVVVLVFAYLVIKNESEKDPNLANMLSLGFNKPKPDDDED